MPQTGSATRPVTAAGPAHAGSVAGSAGYMDAGGSRQCRPQGNPGEGKAAVHGRAASAVHARLGGSHAQPAHAAWISGAGTRTGRRAAAT